MTGKEHHEYELTCLEKDRCDFRIKCTATWPRDLLQNEVYRMGISQFLKWVIPSVNSIACDGIRLRSTYLKGDSGSSRQTALFPLSTEFLEE